jgi:hypothetical protein
MASRINNASFGRTRGSLARVLFVVSLTLWLLDILCSGTATDPQMTKAVNQPTVAPFVAFSGNRNAERHPSCADFNNDGLLDLVMGYGARVTNPAGRTVEFYQNTGTATLPHFTLLEGERDPFSKLTAAEITSSGINTCTTDICAYLGNNPSAADIDGDGLVDLVVAAPPNCAYLKNTGNASQPYFTPQSGTANPFSENCLVSGGGVSCADIDRDGRMDCVFGSHDGKLFFYHGEGLSLLLVRLLFYIH